MYTYKYSTEYNKDVTRKMYIYIDFQHYFERKEVYITDKWKCR